MNALRDAPTSTGTPTRSTSVGDAGRAASRLCVDRSCRTRCPGSAISDSARDARVAPRPSSRSTRKSPTSRDDVVVARVVAASCAARPACASRRSRRPRRRPPEQVGVVAAGGDVVDDRRAGFERGRGDRGLRGVDADRDRGVGGERPDHRDDPARLSSSAATGAAPGRVDSPPTSSTAAPAVAQREAVRDRGVRVEVAPAVGEGIGGDVDDPHDRARDRAPVEHQVTQRTGGHARRNRSARGDFRDAR